MPALEKDYKGRKIHVSVGAIIRDKEGRILLVDRAVFPLGLACIAGHQEEGETPEEGVKREIREETSLKAKKLSTLLHNFVGWNECSKGVKGHDWHVFKAECEGNLKKSDREAKSIGYYTVEEIKRLEEKLEPVWRHFFKELKII